MDMMGLIGGSIDKGGHDGIGGGIDEGIQPAVITMFSAPLTLPSLPLPL